MLKKICCKKVTYFFIFFFIIYEKNYKPILQKTNDHAVNKQKDDK